MLSNFFVYKIQFELLCPKLARKLSGLLRKRARTESQIYLVDIIYHRTFDMGTLFKTIKRSYVDKNDRLFSF